MTDNPLNNDDWKKPPEDMMYDPRLKPNEVFQGQYTSPAFADMRHREIMALCDQDEVFALLYKTQPLVRNAAEFYILEGTWTMQQMLVEIIKIQAMEINRLRDY